MPNYLTTRELAELLRIKERKVYDLVNSGSVPCTKATGKLLFPKEEIAEWLERNSTPASTPAEKQRPVVFLGSHDPLLDWALRESQCGIATWFDGSADGLERYANREGIAAGIHMFDPRSTDWNLPFVSSAPAIRDAVVIAWAHRTRGLIASPDDERRARSVADLAGRRIAPRQPKSGTQQLFLHLLAEAGLREDMLDYCAPMRTEIDAALAVLDGSADVTFGLQAVAQQHGLHFTALVDERYDLVVSRADWFDQPFQTFLDFCRSEDFRKKAAAMPGYDMSAVGKILYNAR
ncbi:substrate-binding domain-containing protein [Oricola sp.]|uniref:substrate-binding domain-containing protein n=1 Tax=Oricola sp. TaxID=1979950 RepID=UPI003BAC4437